MKKQLFIAALLFVVVTMQAQVGINTQTPAATLDVVGKASTTTIPDGIVAPRISKQQLAAKTAGTYGSPQTAAVVFVNDTTAPTGTIPSLAQVVEVTAIGYYYFNGTIWKAMSGTSAADTSIYAGDGSLAGNRNVNQAGSTLAFTGGTTTNSFSVNGSSLSVDALNDRVGIGTTAPLTKLHVVASAAQANRYNLFDAPSSTNQYALIALRNTSPLATGNYSLLGFTNNGTSAGGANWGVGSIRTGAASTTGSEEDFYIGNSLGGTLNERFRINSAGNVGINNPTPDTSAALDIKSTSKGLLIPRVALQSLTDATTVPSPAKGLMIYNTNTALSNGEGLYLNYGTPAAPQWLTYSPFSTNFIPDATYSTTATGSVTQSIAAGTVTNNSIDLGLSIPVTLPPFSICQITVTYSTPIGFLPGSADTTQGYMGIRFLKNGTEAPGGSRKYSIHPTQNGSSYTMTSVGATYLETVTNNTASPVIITYTLNGYIEKLGGSSSKTFIFNMFDANPSNNNFNWGRGTMFAQVFRKAL